MTAFFKGRKCQFSPSLLIAFSLQFFSFFLKAAEEVGYPVMIKASEGGGGKGKEEWRACSTILLSSLFYYLVTILFSSLQSSSSLRHPGFPCRVGR